MYHHLLPVLLLAYPAACSNATCGGQAITYPFWLADSGPSCGYPGLGLFCEENAPILEIEFRQYRVLRIDYANHTISLADVNLWNKTCPRLSYQLSADPSSWLQLTPSNSNVTFLYNCKTNVSLPSAVKLDGGNGCPELNMSWYVFPDDGAVTGEAYRSRYGCEQVLVAPMVDARKTGAPRVNNGSSQREALSGGFEMRYNNSPEQNCGTCEQSGGRCGYESIELHQGTGFTCFCDDGPNELQCREARSSRFKRRKLYIITSTTCVTLLCLLLFACLLGYKKYGSKVISDLTSMIKPLYKVGLNGYQSEHKGLSLSYKRMEPYIRKDTSMQK